MPPVKVMHPLFDFKIANITMNSSMRNDSSKSHHEIISILSNPKMFMNEPGSWKYSNEFQNASNFSNFEQKDLLRIQSYSFLFLFD